jgi:predicted Zn-dependent peptidase
VAVYAGVNPKNVQKAYDAILRVLKETKKEGITQEEFSRAREQIRANGIFAQESTSSQMLWYGRYMLHDNKVYDFDELEKRYDAVTVDDVMRVLNETFVAEKRSAALVGPVSAPLPL